jgi:hypothetical protein
VIVSHRRDYPWAFNLFMKDQITDLLITKNKKALIVEAVKALN